MSRDSNGNKKQRISKISNSGSSVKPRAQKSARPRDEKSEEIKAAKTPKVEREPKLMSSSEAKSY
jgi:23S rRNA pseudouridine2605 synthase